MRLFVTILEESLERALEAVRLIDADHDGVEIRAEEFPSIDFHALRSATRKPIIFTRRGRSFDSAMLHEAIAAGIDLVDVEFDDRHERSSGSGGALNVPRSAALSPGSLAHARDDIERYRDRVVLSYHDFEGMPDLERLARDMRAVGCAHVKIAVTPQSFADNERLLRLLPHATVIGMGERGLYSRILAPFKGSELLFVSRAEDRSAAPGQISLHKALEIYGGRRDQLTADRVFAIVGNPAGHSL